MPRVTMVERTAKEPFRRGDELIAAGRIIQLTPVELKSLVAANCVALTDEENALVPVGDLPPLQAAPGLIDEREIQGRMADARRAAGEEIERLQQNIADARGKADTDVLAQEARIDDARAKADLTVAEHERRAAAAKAAADAAVADHERRALDAKAKADALVAEQEKKSAAGSAR